MSNKAEAKRAAPPIGRPASEGSTKLERHRAHLRDLESELASLRVRLAAEAAEQDDPSEADEESYYYTVLRGM